MNQEVENRRAMLTKEMETQKLIQFMTMINKPEFLAGVSMDHTDKRPAPCFAFSKDGKCPFVNCKYSHNADKIRVYQKIFKKPSSQFGDDPDIA